MSATFSLVCHETRQTIWIGQGYVDDMEAFYSGDEETMTRLRRFLQATMGKPLVLLCDDVHDEIAEYEEFEDPDPD